MQEYAVVEDEIRKLLLQLLREQQKICVCVLHYSLSDRRRDDCIRQDLAEAKHKKMVESEKARERGHVQGMAVAKKAMEGTLVRPSVLRMLALH